MKLFHGSLEIVKNPEIRESSRTLDYGSGFYTTTSSDQAVSWVKRRMKEADSTVGYVNIYSFDDTSVPSLNALIFHEPDYQWVDFVLNNRMKPDFNHNYDLVYGPVANDRVYASFALFEGGLLSIDNLIAELRTYKLVDQYLFHTRKSLSFLTWIEAKEVKL